MQKNRTVNMLCSLILLLFSFTLFSWTESNTHPISSCPEQCVCENSFCVQRRRARKLKCSGVAVNCYGVGLYDIPEGIPPNVTGLLLSNNGIDVINLDKFENFTKLTSLIISGNNATELRLTKNLRYLKRLILKGNHFETLPRKALMKMRNLRELNLENNLIQNINGVRFPRKLDILNLNKNHLGKLAAGSLVNSKLLRVLKLNDNKINRINLKAFNDLSNLQSLEMENNLLHKLRRDAFTRLHNLWYINLNNNRISEIHPLSFRLLGFKNPNHHEIHLENNQVRFVNKDLFNIFVSREDRYSFYFAGNPIFCDCNLYEIIKEATGLLDDTHRMQCDSPPTFVGTIVNSLIIKDCCF